MPMYDYVCTECGRVQEKTHKISENNTEPCEECGAPPESLEKKFSSFSKHVSWTTWRVR